jgi:anti-sigma regulatory factor (Ser/Thr protein kinase)
MVSATHKSFTADDRSYLSLLKKEIHKTAADAGFEEKKLNAIDIVVAEMATNLIKHANGGEILAGIQNSEYGDMLELISIDMGPGMSETKKALIDGHSTSGTLGHGLGSISRMSDFFDIYSAIGWGTIMICRVYKETKKKKPEAVSMHLRSLVIAKPGETVSGDGFYSERTDRHIKILVADGLGHGKEANNAVNEAVSAFKRCKELSPVEIIRYLHAEIKRTRGMVGVVMIYDIKRKLWNMAGVGNISTKFCSPFTVKNYMSYNGIIGHNIPGSMSDHHFEQAEFHEIILCSDGIKTRWDHTKYPGIMKMDQSFLAAAIYKDFGRRTDDMSVIITKVN